MRVDTRRADRKTVELAAEYEPPRVEVLGTLQELTLGGSTPDEPDEVLGGTLSA